MSNLWGKLLCAMFGHKRGRRFKNADGAPESGVVGRFICPRCGATWTRKVKVKP